MNKYQSLIAVVAILCAAIGGAVAWAYMSYMWLESDHSKLEADYLACQNSISDVVTKAASAEQELSELKTNSR